MKSTRGTESYDGKQGWGESHDILRETTAQYIELGYERRQKYNEIAEAVISKMGPNVHLIAPFIKTQESADRKLWDRTSSYQGQPEKLGDYLRCRGEVPVKMNSVAQFSDAMDLLLDHPLTVGYKDSTWRPNPQTAWRYLNVAMNVDGLRCEFQLVARNPRIQAGSLITESLRSVERAIRNVEERLDVVRTGVASSDKQADRTFSKMLVRAENSIRDIRALRTSTHDFVFAATGMNTFVDPKIVDQHEPVNADELIKMFRDAGKKAFGSSIGSKLLAPVQRLVSDTFQHHYN